MNEHPVNPWSALPPLLWLVGVVALTFTATELMLRDLPPLALSAARVAALMSAAASGGFTLGLAVLFALATAAALHWMGTGSMTREALEATADGFWLLVGHALLALVLLWVARPPSLGFEAAMADQTWLDLTTTTQPFAVIRQLRVAALAGAGLMIVVRLWRATEDLFAATAAVALGGSLVTFVLALLPQLAHSALP